MEYIEIVNWEKTQHYKKRNPPWIKLYWDIIDEYDKNGDKKKFHGISDASKITFVMLLCLSVRYDNNIPYPDDKWLKKALGINTLALKELVINKYIVIKKESASKNASTREQRTENREHNKAAMPPWLDVKVWRKFRAHRKAIKAPLTEGSEELIIKTLERLSIEGECDPHDIINQSMEAGWRGLFPLKDKTKGATTSETFGTCTGCGRSNIDLVSSGLCLECTREGD